MKPSHRYIKAIKAVIVLTLLAAMVVTVTSCEDLGFPSTTDTPEETTPEPEPAKTSTTSINTKDAAKLTVYKHLLSLARGHEAKIYLSDFYANCDNWTAESEYFKDGSATWNVVIDMSASTEWELRPYWQQASWFVFKDGEVIPSTLFQANALRIEADLQELSPDQETESD